MGSCMGSYMDSCNQSATEMHILSSATYILILTQPPKTNLTFSQKFSKLAHSLSLYDSVLFVVLSYVLSYCVVCALSCRGKWPWANGSGTSSMVVGWHTDVCFNIKFRIHSCNHSVKFKDFF